MAYEPETLQAVRNSAPIAAEDTHDSLAPSRNRLFEAIVAALRTVHDPEIPVNVFDLGLIYRTEIKDQDRVEIDMTLTAPGCPVAGEMLGWVQKAVSEVEGVNGVSVNLVFDPPWDRSMISEAAKLELGFVDLL